MPNLKTKIVILSVLLLFTFTNNSKAQDTDDDTPIKVNTVLINVPVIATDKSGRNIAGLKKENFSIFQDGEKQNIEFFADTETPMNVAIVIDTSGSTTSILGDIKDAAHDFIKIFGSEDKGMIVSFDHKINVINKLTSDQNELRKAISYASIADEGGSRMYDALYQIVTKDFASIRGRKAIIVLTDGDVEGKTSREKLLDILIESDSLVYPIFFQTRRILPLKVKTITMQQLLNIPPVDFLNTIALATGGRVYAADASNFKGAFQSIAEELKKQYLVGFYSKDSEGGKSNNISVKVDRQDVVIRTKKTIRLKTPNSENK